MIKLVSSVIALLLLSNFSAFSEVPSLKRAAKYQSNIPISVVKKLSIPKGYHEGLYFDGKNIWVSNGKGKKTWVVDIETGGVISEIEPIGKFTEGLTSAGDDAYWVSDWEDKKLYKVKIRDNKMIPEFDIELDPAHPAGITSAGNKLYIITWQRGMGTKYYLTELQEHQRISQKMRIKRIHEPAHIAWDGKNLWMTSWYNKLVYKIDVDTFEVVGSFKSPVAGTTGIAWDGKSLWITGTYADLYEVRIEE
jgi:glutamine cyclotransferase